MLSVCALQEWTSGWSVDRQHGPCSRVLGTHYPCSRPCWKNPRPCWKKSTARQCFFDTGRHGAGTHTRAHGSWTRVPKTHPCSRAVWTRPVNTGSVYRPLVKRFRFKIHALCKKIIYIRSFFSTFKAIAIPIRIPPCSHGSQIQSNQIHRTCYGARRTTSAVGRQTTVTREDQNVEKRWALSLDKNNVKK